MDTASPQPCPCKSGRTYGTCCLTLWSKDYMAALLREPQFAGPQKLLRGAEVETPSGWQPIGEVDPDLLGPDTQIRVEMSEFSAELARRMDEAGLYSEPRPHTSRRKPPPPPPREQRRARRRPGGH